MPLATPIVIGNWKMNGLRRRRARAGPGAAPRAAERPSPPARSALPAGDPAGAGPGGARRQRRSRSAPRTATPRPAAPTPATSARRCWPMPAAAIVIVGHSERRADHGETDAMVRAKAEAAHGRRPDPRSSASARPRPSAMPARPSRCVDRQLDGSLPPAAAAAANLVVAYEPVWAIGTGRTPTVGRDRGGSWRHPRPACGGHGAGGAAIRSSTAARSRPSNAGEILAVGRRRRRAGRRRQPRRRRILADLAAGGP